MWSVGAVFAEILNNQVLLNSYNKPLFKGDSEIDQIFKIFKVFGTPSPDEVPVLTQLDCFKPTFPKYYFLKKDSKKQILLNYFLK
jgi:cyclin-dependent kinase